MRDRNVPASPATGRGPQARGRELRELVNHPHIVEVLEALSPCPQTMASLGTRGRLSRRPLLGTLRILAAHGLVAGDRGGSWDIGAPHTTYRLTDRGRRTVDLLSSFDVWVALYELPQNSDAE